MHLLSEHNDDDYNDTDGDKDDDDHTDDNCHHDEDDWPKMKPCPPSLTATPAALPS